MGREAHGGAHPQRSRGRASRPSWTGRAPRNERAGASKERAEAARSGLARGDAGPQSDVDFLIEIGGDTPPWFPGGLIADLEELLGRPVDVVASAWLNDIIKAGVLAEALPL